MWVSIDFAPMTSCRFPSWRLTCCAAEHGGVQHSTALPLRRVVFFFVAWGLGCFRYVASLHRTSSLGGVVVGETVTGFKIFPILLYLHLCMGAICLVARPSSSLLDWCAAHRCSKRNCPQPRAPEPKVGLDSKCEQCCNSHTQAHSLASPALYSPALSSPVSLPPALVLQALDLEPEGGGEDKEGSHRRQRMGSRSTRRAVPRGRPINPVRQCRKSSQGVSVLKNSVSCEN